MGDRIRRHDWSTSTLGPPEQWSQSLRTVVRLMLTTNHPVFIFWGPQHICFYNDAYSQSLGPEKHPSMLGAEGREAWDEIWPIIGPQIEQVMRGDGATWNVNQLVPITRYGRREDVYWTYSYSPIDDEEMHGGIGGVLVLCNETTEEVLADQRKSFVIALSDDLALTIDPRQALRRAAEALGTRLGVDSVGFTEMHPDGATGNVELIWRHEDFMDVSGQYALGDFGTGMVEELRAGRPVVVDDVRMSPMTGESIDSYRAIDTAAILQIPLIQGDRLSSTLFALSRAPRSWTEQEVHLVTDVAVRAQAAIERARSEKATRDNEALLRTIGETSAEAIYAKDREHRLIYANPATLKAIGRRLDQCMGLSEREWHHDPVEAEAVIAFDDAVMSSNETLRQEERFTPAGGTEQVFFSTKAPMRDGNGEVVGLVGVSSNQTERHRDQLHMRLLVAELNHRVKNTLAIVQSLAFQSFKGAGVPDEARKAFEGRLMALATAHNLLTRERWEATELEAVVVETLAGQVSDPASVTIRGPAVRLDPQTAVSIAMALHELTTNAIKYGALSVAGGHVGIVWTVDGAEPLLSLIWDESGGPPVREPARRGFGTRMIERSLASELRARVTLDFRPEGLRCHLVASVDQLSTPITDLTEPS